MFVDADLKTKLCQHGETSSTIRTWLQHEARAREDGEDPPIRNSTCDCQTVHGLQNGVDTLPGTPPTCVYDVLAANKAASIDVGEEYPAYKLGGHNAFLNADGSFYCVHKNRMFSLTNAARPCLFKVERGKCKCSLKLPKRSPKLCLGRV